MAFALAVFFLSGFAALLYQVVWQRLLIIFSGGDVYSVTIIVAAFMAGLGLGNLAGGHAADRLTTRGNLWLFAWAEVAVGVFGLSSRALYYDVLYQRLSAWSAFPGAAFVLFVSLLWPTFFMGLSLPLLARALTRSLASAGPVLGSLYGWNTLGAATGALTTTWCLLPRLGLEHAVFVGAAINFACAAGAVVLVRLWGSAGRRPATEPDSPLATSTVGATASGMPFPAWALLYGVTGFIALALEIVWFRLLGVMLKSTSFTFGTLLAAYLAFLGAGAAIGGRLVTRSRRPAVVFLATQAALTLVAGLTIVALLRGIEGGYPAALAQHLAGREPFDVYGAVEALRSVAAGRATEAEWTSLRMFVGLYALLPAGLIGLPTFLMGFSFPFLQAATQVDFARIGRRVGALMTANIFGSALGTMLTGWVLLPWLGTATALRLIVGLALLPAGLLARQLARERRVSGWAVGAAFLVATAFVAALLPAGPALWATLHGARPNRVLVAEDGAGLSVLKAAGPRMRGQTLVFVNGLSQSWIPYGNIHTALGALPVLVHPRPEDIAIIGLGSGDTAFSAAGRADVRRVVCIEIIGAQKPTLERLADISPDPGLVSLLNDARFEHLVGDGRAYLERTDRRFDVIEADALRPSSAYAGNLYSQEYFELLRRRLKPGGLAVTWAPTARVRRTFLAVFPHVLAFADAVYIGSNEAIDFDPEAVKSLASSPAVREYYRRAGIDIEALVASYVAGGVEIHAAVDRSSLTDLNSDLMPRDEYALPRILPF